MHSLHLVPIVRHWSDLDRMVLLHFYAPSIEKHRNCFGIITQTPYTGYAHTKYGYCRWPVESRASRYTSILNSLTIISRAAIKCVLFSFFFLLFDFDCIRWTTGGARRAQADTRNAKGFQTNNRGHQACTHIELSFAKLHSIILDWIIIFFLPTRYVLEQRESITRSSEKVCWSIINRSNYYTFQWNRKNKNIDIFIELICNDQTNGT